MAEELSGKHSAIQEILRVFYVLILGCIVFVGIFYISSILAEKDRVRTSVQDLDISFDIASKNCPDFAPLEIKFKNSSAKDLNYVEFIVDAHDDGRSTNYISSSFYNDDRIVKSQDSYAACFEFPKGIPSSVLTPVYSVRATNMRWGD
jgi:hypothetical protein